LIPVKNYSPVSTIPVKKAKSRQIALTGVGDTSEEFFSGIVDTGDNSSPVSPTPVSNLICRLSRGVFVKVRKDENPVVRTKEEHEP
jgi:hypothetical protein